MSEATTIKVVGNVLRRVHASEEETISTSATMQTGLEGHLQLIPDEDWNVTTTSPESSFVALVNAPLHAYHHLPAGLKRYEVKSLYEKAQETSRASFFGLAPVTKNIKWQVLLAPHSTTEFMLFGAGQTEPVAQVALTGLVDAPTARSAPALSELARYLLTFSALPYAKTLAARILELDQDLMDEAEGERLASQSVFSLIRFLHSNAGIARPALAAGRGGYLIGRWTRQGYGEVNIHFRPEGSAIFYAFVPNEEDRARQDFLSASTTIESLCKRLAQFQLLNLLR